MPRYRYVAMDSGGSETEGVIDAKDQSQAVSMIRSKGLFPTRVSSLDSGGSQKSEKSAKKKGPASASKGMGTEIKLPSFFGGRIKPKQLMVFTRQLATLVDAGLPLLRGLRILLKQEKTPALRNALTGMGESVEGGSTFSEALAQFPKLFDNLFVNMVKAGEAGGVLEQVLARLAESLEKSEKIKAKVKSAMVYPIVVLVAAIGILVFLMIYIIPKFATIFDELLGGKALPPLTQFVINLSNVIAHRWIMLIVGVFVIIIVMKAIRASKQGRFALDALKLKMPLFGSLFKKYAVSRFARTLGTLMTAGVPILQALNIVRDTAGNGVIANAIQGVHDNVKEGESMSMPLEASGVFPGMVVSMVDVGEETGALPEMLLRVADNYDDEVDTAVEGMTSVIEPIMLVLLALIIGTIVIAMFVPLISIVSGMATG